MADVHPLAMIAVAVAWLAVLSSCNQENRYVAPPAPKVTVALPVKRTVTRYLEFTGSAAAVNSADLVARVPGFVQGVNYEDGAQVKKGALLFTIEPEPYEIKLKQAQAAEAGAQASLKQTQADFDRQASLVNTQAVSRQQYDQALAARDAAQANLIQAQVNTKLASLNEEYAHVSAPFDGIVTARQVSVGEYVGGSGTPTVLATIVQPNPIYVNFNVSEQDVLQVRARAAQRGMTREDLGQIPVEVGLQTEDGFPHVGKLDYAAPSVNASTGTLAARAVFQNSDRALMPGYFVRVRIPFEKREDALLIPDVALGSDQGGPYVLVVNSNNVVEHRNVKTGQLDNGLRVIESGLAAEDRVVIAGVLRAIPGQRVDPQLQEATATATSAKQPAAP
jgi:RND family efflux transporter MFP subunit